MPRPPCQEGTCGTAQQSAPDVRGRCDFSLCRRGSVDRQQHDQLPHAGPHVVGGCAERGLSGVVYWDWRWSAVYRRRRHAQDKPCPRPDVLRLRRVRYDDDIEPLRGHVAAVTILSVGLFIPSCFPRSLRWRSKGWASDAASVGHHLSGDRGGAVVPLTTGVVADHAGLSLALLVPAACYIWIAFYGLYAARHKVPHDAQSAVPAPVMSV